MSIKLEISLDRDIRELQQFMSDYKFKAVVKSARQAINRAAKSTKSNAIQQIRKQRNLKLKDAKKFVDVKRAKGSNLFDLEGRVDFTGIPLPLILFIVGQKSPRKQTQSNPRRRSRSFEIVKGLKQKRKGLFIQKAKRGGRRYQVFRRDDPSDRTKGYRKQSAPSIAEFMRKKGNVLAGIENHAIARLQREFDSALANNLRSIKL